MIGTISNCQNFRRISMEKRGIQLGTNYLNTSQPRPLRIQVTKTTGAGLNMHNRLRIKGSTKELLPKDNFEETSSIMLLGGKTFPKKKMLTRKMNPRE